MPRPHLPVLLPPLLAAALAVVACSKDPAELTRQYIASGDDHARKGELKKAVVEYRNAIKTTPDSAEAQNKLADAASRANDPDLAVPAIVKAAALNPDDVTAQVRAASLYLLAGRYEEARDHARAALRADVTAADAHIVLGHSLAALHDAAASGEALAAAVRIAPDSPEARIALGSHHWRAGRVSAAEAELRKAVALGPAHVGANRSLAIFYMARGAVADAEPYWRAVAAQADGDPFAAADYLVVANRLDEAERELQQLATRTATRDQATLRLAAVRYAKGDRASAHQTVDTALERENVRAAALVLKGQFQQAEGRLEEAARSADDAVAAAPASADAVLFRATLQAQRGEVDRAIQSFRSAAALQPGDPAAWLALARLMLRQNRAADAISPAKRALAVRDTPAARTLVIAALAGADRHAQARAEAEAAINAWPEEATFLIQLGTIDAAQGNHQAARERFEQVLARNPKSVDALAAVTELDLRTGNTGRAIRRLAAQPAAGEDPAVMLLASRAHAAAKDYRRAEELLDRAIRKDERNLQAMVMLGELHLATGRLDAARDEFERLAARADGAGPATMVGMIYEMQGRPADAQRQYEATLVKYPRAGVAANNLACLYHGQGRFDEALRWALIAHEELRRSPESSDTLGWVYVALDRPRDAISALSVSVDARPDNPVYRYHLALAYRKAGLDNAAREQLRRAIASKAPFSERDHAAAVLREITVASSASR
jgi:tetratricopeptide (TPR) repeat protein